MNDYVEAKNARVLFEHWMEADYLNESNQTVIHKPDGGAPPKQLTNSYSNAYLDTNDTDQDGLFDFVEWQIGTDAKKVDTDGDGVPDGKEFMEDKDRNRMMQRTIWYTLRSRIRLHLILQRQ